MNAPNRNQTSKQKPICPQCKKPGKKVELLTVRALIQKDYIDTILEEGYSFCANPDCVVVYYAASSNGIIKKDRVKTRVGLKEKEEPRPVCYCFGTTVEDIHREIRETAKSTVEKDISDKIEARLCHCEDANPEGRCCLGNVAIAVKEGFRLYSASKEEKSIHVGTTNDCCRLE